MTTKLSVETTSLLRCPHCLNELSARDASFDCTDRECGRSYPLITGGIPVLIDEERSVFSIASFVEAKPTFFRPMGRVASLLKRLVPELGLNFRSKENYADLRERLLAGGRPARVLVLGGSIEGEGIGNLRAPQIEIVETDVAVGPRAKLICDGHSIPFADGSFDAVVAQAVLEHVLDPFRVVAEIHRVLKSSGWIYAETPFMQQVHGGAYDFLRFSHLGYLRLFRNFIEVKSGAVAGPATALAWAYEFFLLSLFSSRKLRPLVKAFARFTALPFKYADYLLIDRPAALDAASGFYFLGRKSEAAVSDRDLIAMYRGAGG